MKAMILSGISHFEHNINPLHLVEVPVPEPKDDEVLIRVKACGVCHTDLDEIEGRAVPSFYPVILGHQIIGIVEKTGEKAYKYKTGDRLGVGWFFSSCGKCSYCLDGRENLCASFRGTGMDANGGYAEYMCLPENSAFGIPGNLSDEKAAPLLCGGSVGFRGLKISGIKNNQVIGLMGFGGSGHQVLQIARFLYPDIKIYVFARSEKSRMLAISLGADWAGDISSNPPELCDSIIDTTPSWKPVVKALGFLKPGGKLVINAISKENSDKDYLLNLVYQEHLWLEKEIKTVANVTRKDIADFISMAADANIKTVTQAFPLEEANEVLNELKKGKGVGTRVLVF